MSLHPALQSLRQEHSCSLGTPSSLNKLGGSFTYIRCVCSGREELPK